MTTQKDLEDLDKAIAAKDSEDEKDEEDNAEEEEDEEAEETEKPPKGILMGANERNTTKSVTFDEDNNIVREFSKHQKIEKGRPPKFNKDEKKA